MTEDDKKEFLRLFKRIDKMLLYLGERQKTDDALLIWQPSFRIDARTYEATYAHNSGRHTAMQILRMLHGQIESDFRLKVRQDVIRELVNARSNDILCDNWDHP